MSKQIYVNLPVSDLKKSTGFYEALGFTKNAMFSDSNASSMMWSNNIVVMLLKHDFYKKFIGEKEVADTPKGMEFQTGSRVSLTLNGDDEPLLRSYWDKLAADGKVTVPLEKAPWGDTFGMLTDKFGVEWMIDIGPVQ